MVISSTMTGQFSAQKQMRRAEMQGFAHLLLNMYDFFLDQQWWEDGAWSSKTPKIETRFFTSIIFYFGSFKLHHLQYKWEPKT